MHPFRPYRRNLQRGFTLIELLVTVSVLAVLMAVAIPNLRSFIVSNRLSSDVNNFIGFINYARSEAIVRNQSVLICPKNNASNACVSTQFWAEYDIEMFVDVDGNNAWSTGDVLLKTMPAIDTSTSQTVFNKYTGAGYLKFAALGMSISNHRLDMYAVGDATYNAQYGRTICISKPGRARVIPLMSGTGSCSDF